MNTLLKLAVIGVLALGGYVTGAGVSAAKAHQTFNAGVNVGVPVATTAVQNANSFADWTMHSTAGQMLGSAVDTMLLAGANSVASGWRGSH